MEDHIETYGLDLHFVSLFEYICRCNSFESQQIIEKARNQALCLSVGNQLCGRVSGVHRPKLNKRVEQRKFQHVDANNLFGLLEAQPSTFADIGNIGKTSLETTLATKRDAGIDSFLEVDKRLPFFSSTRTILAILSFTDYMRRVKRKFR